MPEKNIMLLFLSKIALDNSSGKPRETEYSNIGKDKICVSTNESAIKYLLNQGITFDNIIMFQTDAVKATLKAPRPAKYKPDLFQRNEKNEYLEDGQIWTSADYFRRRMLPCIKNYDDLLVHIDYIESEPIDKAMFYISQMADKIIEAVKGSSFDEVVIHADFTGGMRHANVMMLVLLRLAQYRGIRIGKILYSNYENQIVEEANTIYNLFDMISGIDEFVNFGSINTINRYFSKLENKSTELENLLTAMKNFAEQIRLCHRGKLVNAVIALRQAAKQFENAELPKENIQETIMKKLLHQRIYEEYQDLFADDIDDINDIDDLTLIEWCLNHDYLQQALTLYVERIPQVLTQTNKCITIAEEHYDRLYQEYKENQSGEIFEYWCLTNHKEEAEEEESNITEINNGFKKIIIEAMSVLWAEQEKYPKGNPSGDSKKIFNQAIKLLDNYIAPKSSLRYTKRQEIEDLISALSECIYRPAMLKEDQPIPKKLVPLINVLEGIYKNKWHENPNTFGTTRLKLIRKTLENHFPVELFGNIKISYAHQILKCIEKGIYILNKISKEELISILEKYRDFKLERNNSNHAKLDGIELFSTADELKTAMKEAIKELRKALKKD